MTLEELFESIEIQNDFDQAKTLNDIKNVGYVVTMDKLQCLTDSIIERIKE